MSVIARIEKKLRRHPDLLYRVEGNAITVLPPTPDGFAVSFEERNGMYTVYFDGWHEHFASDTEALNCFAFGLSGECRLRVARRGGVDYR